MNGFARAAGWAFVGQIPGTRKRVNQRMRIGSGIAKSVRILIMLLLSWVWASSGDEAWGALTDGLVAYYPFDGNANDATANGHHGVLYGSVGYAPGIRGQAAVFQGNGYITAVDNSVGNLGTSGSLVFWMRPAAQSLDGAEHRPWEKDYGTWWMFLFHGSNFFMTLKGAPSYRDNGIELVNPITAGEWYSIIAVKSGQTVDTYINGLHVDSKSTGADYMTTSAYMTFGRSQYWNSQYFWGMIDEARVYDRALTAAEIADLSVPEPQAMGLLLAAGLLLRRRATHQPRT